MTAFNLASFPPITTASPPPPPEMIDLGPMNSTELAPRAYLGLWDVYADGTSEGLAGRLRNCAECNAHPDWVGYKKTANQCGVSMLDRVLTVNEGLRSVGWWQTAEDVEFEILQREEWGKTVKGRKVESRCVFQRFHAPVTFQGEISVGA